MQYGMFAEMVDERAESLPIDYGLAGALANQEMRPAQAGSLMDAFRQDESMARGVQPQVAGGPVYLKSERLGRGEWHVSV